MEMAAGGGGAAAMAYEIFGAECPEEAVTKTDVTRIIKEFARTANLRTIRTKAAAIAAVMVDEWGVSVVGLFRFVTADMLETDCDLTMTEARYLAEYLGIEYRAKAADGQPDPPTGEVSNGANEGDTGSPVAEAAGGDSKSLAESGNTTASDSAVSVVLSNALTMLAETQQQMLEAQQQQQAREEKRAAKSELDGKSITLDTLEMGAGGKPTLRNTHKWMEKTVAVALRTAKGLPQAIKVLHGDPRQVARSDFIGEVSVADDEAIYDLVKAGMGEAFDQMETKAEKERAALEQRSGMGLLYDLEKFAMKPDPKWMASQVNWIYNKVETIEQGQDIHERWDEWYSAMYQQQFADTFTGSEMVLSMEKLMQRFGPEMNKAKTESGYNTGADWKTYVNAMKQEVQEMPKVDGTESAEIGGTVQGAQSRGHYSGGTDSDMREADKGEKEEDHYEEEEEEEDHYEEEEDEEDEWADEAHDS